MTATHELSEAEPETTAVVDAEDWSTKFVLKVLGLATVALTGVRLWAIAAVPSPFLFADETVSLGLARWLAGESVEYVGPSGRSLMGILLTPVAAVSNSPVVLHTGAQLLNVVLGGLLLPVLYAIGRRVLVQSRANSATMAIAGAASSAAIAFTPIAFPEQLLLFVSALAVLMMHRVAHTDRALEGPVLGLMIGLFLSGTHARADAMVIAALLTLLGALAVKAINRLTGWLTIGGIMAGAYAAITLSRSINEQIYAGVEGSSYSTTLLLRSATNSPVLIARAAVGSVWYLVVASLGIVALGLVGAATRVRTNNNSRVAAAFIILSAAGSLAASSIFVSLIMAGGGRVDTFAYGRYVEHLLPILFVCAPLGWATKSRRLLAWAISIGALVLGALHAIVAYSSDFWTGAPLKTNISMIWFFWDRPDPIHPITASAVAAVLTTIVLSFDSDRVRRWAVIPIGAAGVAAAVSLVISNLSPFSVYIKEWKPVSDHLVSEDVGQVAIINGEYPGIWRHALQFWANDVTFRHYPSVDVVDPEIDWLITLDDKVLPPSFDGELSLDRPDQTTIVWRRIR